MKKTAMQQLFDFMNESKIYPSHIDTLAKINELLSVEKQQIIDAANEIDKKCCIIANKTYRALLKEGDLFSPSARTGENYFYQTYQNNTNEKTSN